jgi:hypothetical protein
MSRTCTLALEAATALMAEACAQVRAAARDMPRTFATIGAHGLKNS